MSYNDQAMRYYELVNQGVPPAEAFRQAFPDGIPTAEDRAKKAAKDAQEQGLGQVAGTVGGALGTSLLIDAVSGGGAAATGAGAAGAAGAGAAGAAGAGAAPTIVSVSPVGVGGGAGAAGAGAAGTGAATGITNFAGAATPFLGAAGTALGAYGMYDSFENKDPGMGALSGAGAGLGLAMLGLGPVGWLAGGGALLGGGAALLNKMGDKDMWQTEGKRLRELEERGVAIPEHLREAMNLSGGRSLSDLVKLEEERAARGEHSNVAFAKSRNEGDLTAEDIWGYSAFFDKYGNDWLNKFSEDQRRQIAQAALNAGAVDEHHGTVDINWTPELDSMASGITGGKLLEAATGSKAPPQTVVQNRPAAPMAPGTKDTQIGSANLPPLSQFQPVARSDYGKYGIAADDPNSYSVAPNGQMIGTLIGRPPPGMDMKKITETMNNGQPVSGLKLLQSYQAGNGRR